MSYKTNPHYNGVTQTPGVWNGGPGCTINGPGVAPIEPEELAGYEGMSPEEGLEGKLRGQADTATVSGASS